MADRRLIQSATFAALFAICVVSGCASTGQTGTLTHPIVGTWVLNPAKFSEQAAKDPAFAMRFTGTLTFTPDGKYHSVTNFDGVRGETDGTFRIVGSDVYIDIGHGETKGLYEIRGNELFVSDKHEPGVLVFDRK